MAEPQEGLTEEWLKLEDDILSIVAAYGSEVLARRDTKVGLVTLTAEARNEIAAKLRTLGYSSPQEVKEQVRQARREIAEWGNVPCPHSKPVLRQPYITIPKRKCPICWQLLLEKEG